MSRHRVSFISDGVWRLMWTVDRYYAGSRQRHPRVAWRDTDREGAQRFCAKWGIPMTGLPR